MMDIVKNEDAQQQSIVIAEKIPSRDIDSNEARPTDDAQDPVVPTEKEPAPAPIAPVNADDQGE